MRKADPIGERIMDAIDDGVPPEDAADVVLGFAEVDAE